MKYVVLGVVAFNGSNQAVAGQETYLVGTSDWHAWDGTHAEHATKFATAKLALAAAHACRGPIFRMPVLASIHVIGVDD